MTDRDEQLRFAIETFLASQPDTLTTPSRVVNQLLSLWATAHEIGPEVAAPLEGLLGATTQRNLISKDELEGVLNEVLALASAVKAASPSV